MKIATMADIHSNHIALERCIAEAKYRDSEEFIFLRNWKKKMQSLRKQMLILKRSLNTSKREKLWQTKTQCQMDGHLQ